MSELKDVKPGDVVAAERPGRGAYAPDMVMLTVARVTPTQLVTRKGERIRIRDGHLVGSGPWSQIGSFFVPTASQVAKHRAQIAKRRRYMNLWEWLRSTLTGRTLTIEQLVAMKAAYDGATNNTEERP